MILNLKNIKFAYGKEEVIHGINLTLNKGEKVAILGANGAGKSTLIDIILGIKKPKEGSIKWNIENNLSPKDILGTQFQTKDFPTGLKVKQFLSFYLTIFNMKLEDEKVQNLLREYKMINNLNKPLKGLSGGQQQMFNILTMIINDPKFIIIDEVLTGLDITSQESVISSLEKKIKNDNNLTFITISHSPLEIKRLVNRIVLIDKGNKKIDMSLKEIEKKYQSIDKFFATIGVSNENNKE